MIEISNNGMTFFIDRTNEIPDWSSEQIQSKREEVKEILKKIFSSETEILHKGNKTEIRFFDKNQNQIMKYKYFEGIGLNWLKRTDKQRYAPFFEKE